MVKNGYQALFAVIVVSAIALSLVYAASLPVTGPDGTVEPKESVLEPLSP